MKKFSLFLFVALVTLLLSSCGKKTETTITLLQNKPEIDAQLKAEAAQFEKDKGIKVNVVSCGGSCSLGNQMTADYNAGTMPDIFIIQGSSDYTQWKSEILSLDGQPWISNTDYAYTDNGHVYGFPVAIEGYGMIYNKTLLDKAGVDPATLDTFAGYQAAFQKIDAMKSTLGITSVVAGVASTQVSWTMTDHDFNAYLSNGLSYNDLSVVNDVLAGNVDATRMQEYADWVHLLYQYSDPSILATGTYAQQEAQFFQQKAVFIHQGDWIGPDWTTAITSGTASSFPVGIAPYGSLGSTVTDGIFVAPASWYVIDKNSKHISAAEEFLDYLATPATGENFLVNQTSSVAPWKNFTETPSATTAPLAAAVASWVSQGSSHTYAWNQYYLTSNFRSNSLGPIYQQFAAGTINEATFIQQMTAAINNIKTNS